MTPYIYTPVLVTPPADPVVTLAEAKAHCRVDSSDDDDLITALVAAATSHLDGWSGILGRALMPQTWEVSFDCFPAREIRIPLGPVASVTSVKYVDTDGVTQTVSSDDYETDLTGVEGWVVPVADFDWPETMDTVNAVTVRWVAGTGCPPAIKQAVLLLVGHWYENREASANSNLVALPMAVDALIAPLRRVGL